jgi:PAS domain S-box-containing protein
MSQRIRLLYLNVRPANYKQVSEHLGRAGIDFYIQQTTSVQTFWDELTNGDYDLVLLDKLLSEEHLATQLVQMPLVLLADKKKEDAAISALEQGTITDYIISSDSGFRRLPLVVRAVLARRNSGASQPLPNTAGLHLFTQLKGGYDALVVVNQAGKIIYQTKESVNWSGYSREDLENMNPLDLIHKSDAKNILPLFSELIANPGGEESTRLRILHKDKTWHWYDVAGKNMLADPLVGGIVIRYSDITKRRQDEVQQDAVYRIAQATLVTESLDDLFSSIHTIISEVIPAENFYIALYDSESELVHFPYYQDEYDESPGEPAQLGKGLTAYVIRSAQSLLCNRHQFNRLKEQGKVTLIGTAFAVWLGVPLIIGNQVFGVIGVQHYEDESVYSERDKKFLEFVSSQIAFAIYRKQTEVDLRESELRFRSLFENSTIGIYRSTPDGRLLLVNPALLRLSGYEDFDELTSIDLSQSGYFYPEDRIRFQELLEKDEEIRGMESVWRKKDGSAIYVRESARVIHDEQSGEIYYEGIVEDISDRKQAEQALEDKVVALETLAEVDSEILHAKDTSALLELVCRRAADLLKAPKACIASIGETNAEMLAIYGFCDVETLHDEFLIEPNLNVFNRWKSFSIRSLTNKNFSRLMAKTRDIENIHSVIAESFEIDHGVRAVLSVFDTKPRNWSADDHQYLKFLVGQVAISLEKAKLLRDAEYRAKNFEMLYSLAGEIAATRDFDDVLNVIVKSTLYLFNTHCGFIYLYDDVDDSLELRIIHGVDLDTGIKMKLGEGMAGRVAKSRKPKRVDNYRGWSYRNRKYDSYKFSAVMEVPMIYRNQLIGVLAVAEIGETQRVFTDDNIRLLSLFAGQAASAVYDARLFSEIQQRNDELDRLYRALGLLIAGVSSDRYQLSQSICEIVLSEFNHSNCSIWLVNQGSLKIERFGTSGAYIIDELNLTVDGAGLIPKAIREGIFINIGNVKTNEDYLNGWSEAASELVIPLVVENSVIGVIDLQSAKPSAFSQDDERLMTLFSVRAALMLEHARLVEQTEERNLRLDTLHAIETSFASSLDLRVSLDLVIEQIQSRLKIDAASVYIYDEDLQMLEIITARGMTMMTSVKQRIRVGEGFPGKAALEQEIIYIPDLTRPGPALQIHGSITVDGFKSAFFVPLVAKGQLRGVLELFYCRSVHNDPDWMGFLETLARQISVAIDGIQVFHRLQQSLIEQQVAQDAIVESWSHLLEMRGLEPKGHNRRVSALTLELARRMGIEDKELASLYKGILLHDIGKLLLPDSIVNKPGPLTDDEWELVYLHPVHAHELISKISPFQSAASIPYCHHEYWDGSGYPRGLKGEDIPLGARIFQVVETWDLMQVDLPYRKAFEKEDVLEYIQSESDKRFDPRVVEKFLSMINT